MRRCANNKFSDSFNQGTCSHNGGLAKQQKEIKIRLVCSREEVK